MFVDFRSVLFVVSVPKTMSHALIHPSWNTTMQDEIISLDQIGTWELVDPHDCKPISCRWVYSVKYYPDGPIE